MKLTVEQITAEALSLPMSVRAALADQLVESLDPSISDKVNEIWSDESLRRLHEVRRGSVTAIAGDTALQQVRSTMAR